MIFHDLCRGKLWKLDNTIKNMISLLIRDWEVIELAYEKISHDLCCGGSWKVENAINSSGQFTFMSLEIHRIYKVVFHDLCCEES